MVANITDLAKLRAEGNTDQLLHKIVEHGCLSLKTHHGSQAAEIMEHDCSALRPPALTLPPQALKA
jgi:hypothetical protein